MPFKHHSIDSMGDPAENTITQKKRKRINSNSSITEDSSPKKIIRGTKSIPNDVYKVKRVNSLQSINSVNSVLDFQIGCDIDLDHVADLLNILDERDVAIPPGLESVFKSLEEEIMSAPEKKRVSEMAKIELGSRELVYLLEASDDELGLPPRGGEDSGLEFTGENREMSGYEPLDFGICGCGADYVAWDGGFDDVAEDTKVTWHQEGLLKNVVVYIMK